MDKITFSTIYNKHSLQLKEYVATFEGIQFLTIHAITFNKLSELLKELNGKISESNEKISEILLNIVTIFNDYIDNININNKSIIIKELYQLYIEKIKGLNKENKDNILTTLTRNIHGIILLNIEYVIDTISNICTDEIIKSNSTIIYYLSYAIYKSIIILYTYEYYLTIIKHHITYSRIKNFNLFKIYLQNKDTFKLNASENNKHVEEEEEEEEEEDEDEDDKDEDDEDEDDEDEDDKIFKAFEKSQVEKRLIEPLTISELSTIYNEIIQEFIKKVLISNNATLSINLINTIGEAFIKRNPNYDTHQGALNIILNSNSKGIYYILIIKNYLISNRIAVSNNIITIPQYIGICWYISMLTGICYSDASRKLILSKINDLKAKLSTSTIETSETNFIKTVIYIIETITEPQLKYGDNIKENCNIFKYFKNELPMFLHLKYNEITESLIRENGLNQRINDSEIAGSDDYYFINIINRISKNGTIPITTTTIPINMTGLTIYGFGILNMLYKMLAIDSYYFLNIQSQIYKKKLDSAIINPDIIIIQKLSQFSIENYIKSSLFEEDITDKILFTNENSETFTFNGNNYKLDYVLYANTATNNECTREGCGHCISAINYHGEKYYYNSGNAEKNFNCDVESIRIPCTLNRQDWNINNIKTPHFTINKCFYRNVDLSKNDIKIEKDIIDESQLYFDNDDIICVYVKVGKVTEGGKNTTYKSTHKKVNIMNKNKTIIERIVYIDNNKNKFIKFNKKYESLSTFKYNRKNKYYYI